MAVGRNGGCQPDLCYSFPCNHRVHSNPTAIGLLIHNHTHIHTQPKFSTTHNTQQTVATSQPPPQCTSNPYHNPRSNLQASIAGTSRNMPSEMGMTLALW